ncbi:hypothetical protein NYR55_11555 [Sphingomonas sp. BGYR3]|uniref:hypothetical protein n=1 Tax=Sphingomonas sp. BGYR3 TaxID=2975483 RepID=UPI0021A79554|nr:hypothetical protein [Sphingomonas sp. BGYR3]MDG5489250.1 hypothetical protein [Sphingomonas sp. BGYR3]
MTLDSRAERARGYVVMAILYVHLLGTFLLSRPDPSIAPLTFIQIKLLAPHVSVFFLLAGMSAPRLGQRGLASVLSQSVMLLLLAAVSHAIGYWIGPFLHDRPDSWSAIMDGFLRPLVTGTGFSTFVAWFFIAFAFARLFAHLLQRDWRMFVVAVAGMAAIIWAGRKLGMPDNWLEWRTLPAATAFFLIGQRIPARWQVPAWLGVLSLFATLAIAWFNRPGILRDGPCLACNVQFVSQPMVGQFGSAPVFLVQELSFLLFLLWVTQPLPQIAWQRVPRLFGHNASAILLLHGWVIAALFPLLPPLFPEREQLWLFPVLLIGGVVAHAGMFLLFRPALERVLALCMVTARLIVEAPGRLVRPAKGAAKP